MATTDLRRRELLEQPPFPSLSSRVTSLRRVLDSLIDYQIALEQLNIWLREHSGGALRISGPNISPQDVTPFQVMAIALADEELFRVQGAGFDDVLWGWGWLIELNSLAFRQTKKRQHGLFIKARRTRSPQRNRLYIRIPHR